MKLRIKNCIVRSFLFVMMFFVFFTTFGVVTNAETQRIVIDGKEISLRDGTKITIDTDYKLKGQEFRAVWVSALTGDISTFSSEEQYKAQMITVLNTLEYYNMNALIFHVRIMNDAFYESQYNSWSTYYSTNPTWEVLPWLIEECHKRGIEFHAWMNPYRVSTNPSQNLTDVAARYKTTNAASNPNNLIKTDGYILLNPGEPEVRDFLVNTCMELAMNYDIDAIHFDDYFYATGIDDSATRAKYNTTGMSTDNWRRHQVDLFIERLATSLDRLNSSTGRCVQLGISPSGVYRNGNGIVTYDSSGNAISNGSSTSAYSHYDSPLYADTLKWINNQWIDYILPQSYWAITNPYGPFCDLASWWNKAVKNSGTNLYMASGLYLSSSTSSYSWNSNPKEGYYQILYSNSLENVRGMSIYNYLTLASSLNGGGSFDGVKDLWSKPVIVPEVRTMEPRIVSAPTNVTLESTQDSYRISFDKNDKAKFYVIYKSETPITYSADEVLDVIGNVMDNGKVSYTDTDVTTGKKYYYAVKCLSNTNTLSEGVKIDTTSSTIGEVGTLGEIDFFVTTDNLFVGEKVAVCWKRFYYPFGTDVNYKIIYNFDGGNNTEITSFTSFSSLNAAYITIPDGVTVLNVSLEISNNIGKSVTSIQKTILPKNNKILGFGNIGEVKGNGLADFVFTKNGEGQYLLQYSYNQLDWYDDKTIDPTSNFIVNVSTTVPNITGSIYYRIKKVSDTGIDYSEVLSFLLTKTIGNFTNFTVCGEAYDNSIDIKLSENDKFVISFDAFDEGTNYSVMYTSDLSSWVTITSYSREGKYEIVDGKYVFTLPINYKYVKVYFQVVASNSDGYSTSSNIRVYCSLEYLYAEDMAKFYNDEIKTKIKEINIFN